MLFQDIPQGKQYPMIQICLINDPILNLPVSVDGDLYIDGRNIKPKAFDGWNELHLAAWNGDVAGVQSALAKGIKIFAGNVNGWMPIHLGAQQGHTVIVDILLKAGGIDRINCGNKLGWTPLHVAVWSGHVDIINLLLDYGMEAMQGNKFGWNSAHVAAWNGKQSSLEILRSKVGLEIGNNEGWSTIHLATWNNKLDTVKWLVEACNVDVNSGNQDGWRSLHIASYRNYEDILEFLLLGNAVLNVKTTEYSITPLTLAAMKQHMNIIEILVVNAYTASITLSLEYIEDTMRSSIDDIVRTNHTALSDQYTELLKSKNYVEAQKKIDTAIKICPTALTYYNKAIVARALESDAAAIAALDLAIHNIIDDEVLKHNIILYKSSIQYTNPKCEYSELASLLSAVLPQKSTTDSTDIVKELFEQSKTILDNKSNLETLPHILLFLLHQYDLKHKDTTMEMIEQCLEALAASVAEEKTVAVQAESETTLCKIYRASINVLQEIKYGGEDVNETLLHIAVRESSANSVKFLIDMGWKDLNILSYEDISPLYLALVCKENATVEVLLDNHANIYLEEVFGCHQPIIMALRQFSSSVGQTFLEHVPKQDTSMCLKLFPLDILSEVEDDFGRCEPTEMQALYSQYEVFFKLMGYDTSNLGEYLPC